MSPFPHGPLNKPLWGYLKLLKSPCVWLVRMATYKIRFTKGRTDINTGKQDVGRFVPVNSCYSQGPILAGVVAKKHWNQSQSSRPIKNLNDTINRPISIVWNPYWTIYIYMYIYIYSIQDFQMKKYCETAVNPYKTPWNLLDPRTSCVRPPTSGVLLRSSNCSIIMATIENICKKNKH
jgi:hypothetical protein